MNERRAFLKRVGAGVLGADVLATLLSIREATAEEIDGLGLSRLKADTFGQLRREYMLSPDVVYLNHASIGTTPRAVHEARVRYLDVCESNPWLYMWGGAWEEPRESVRQRAAAILGVPPETTAITHNTTEAFNVLANGLPLGSGDEVVFSSLNHTGASAPFFHAARRRGFTVTRFQFPVADVPTMSASDVVDAYAANVTSRTRLLVFPAIDNMVGIRHPVRDLTAMARARRVDWVAVDGAQSVGMLPVHAGMLGVDVYATSPHKWLQAPKGLGLASFSPAIQEVLEPMWVTWGQNRWKATARKYEDYGTRNFAETLALGDAIDFQSGIRGEERETRLRALWAHTRERALAHEATAWASPHDWSLGTSLYSVALRRADPVRFAREAYERHGIVFRPFNTQGLKSVRLSPNVISSEDDIDRVFALL